MAHVRKHRTILKKYRNGVPEKVEHAIESMDLSYNSSVSQTDEPFKMTNLDYFTEFAPFDPVQGTKNLVVTAYDFDRLLRFLKTWIAEMPHTLVCQLVKRIVHHCSPRHLQMLATVVQPVKSRSFIYTAGLSKNRQLPPASSDVTIKAKLKAKKIPIQSKDKISSNNGDKCSKKLLPGNSDFQRIVNVSVSKTTDDRASPKVTHPSKWQNISTYTETLHLLKNTTEMEKRNLQNESNILPAECQNLIYFFSRESNDLMRVVFLQKLLMSLDAKQMYYLSDLIQGRKHRDFVGDLPTCLAKRILTYLSTKELSIICQVCKKWRQLSSSDDIWKAKCQQTRFTLPKELIARRSSWKEIYKDNKNLQENWAGGFCQTLELNGHTDKVLALALSTDRVASGSSDKTVRIWGIYTGNLQQTFYGHQRGVWCVRFFTHNIVISGSYDTTIRIWNIQHGNLVRTLFSHRGPVWVLVSHGDLLLTASQDKTAKIWQVSKTKVKYNLTGHTGAIFSGDLSETGHVALTGSTDKSVRIWDTESGLCRRVIHTSNPEPILALSYSQGFVACAQGTTVTVFHSMTNKLIAVYNEHKDRIETVQLRMFSDKYQHPFQNVVKNIAEDVRCQGMVISAGRDGLVKFWDVSPWPTSVHTFNERRCKVNCAQFDDLRIVSVSRKHRIIIRDFGYSLYQDKLLGTKKILHLRQRGLKL